MDASVRRLVRRRAADRCEYCGLSQADVPLVAFHVEHIIARQHGGSDDPSNLALASYHCNLHKSPNLTGIDPESGQVTRLFDPRQDAWEDHFDRIGTLIVGRTPIGRATVAVLAMNADDIRELRAQAGA